MKINRLNIDKKWIPGYKRKIFLLLAIWVYVPFLISGIIAAQVYGNELTKHKDAMLVSDETQIQTQVSNILSSIRQYYLNLSNESAVKWLLTNDEIPYSSYSELKQAQQLLFGGYYLNRYISDYYFINTKSETPWILSGGGMMHLNDVGNCDEVKQFINSQANDYIYVYWLNNMGKPSSVSENGSGPIIDLSGELLVVKLKTGIEENSGYILAHMNRSMIQKLIDYNSVGEYKVCILNQDNHVIFGNNDEFSDAFSNETDLVNHKEIKLENGSKYRIEVKKDSDNQMIYVVGYDVNHIKAGMLYIMIIGAVIIISITFVILIWISTSHLYKPVQNLLDYTEKLFGSKHSEDEFTYITEEVGNLAGKHEQLKQVVQQQRQILKSSFFTHLLRGDLPPDSAQENIKRFHLETNKFYRLIALDCLIETSIVRIEDSNYEIEMLNTSVIENCPPEILNELFLPPVTYAEKLMFVIGDQEEDTLKLKLEKLHEQLTGYIKGMFGCSIVVGVSQTFGDPIMIKLAYYECMEAQHNINISENNKKYGLAYWEDFAKKDAGHNGYNMIYEKSIVNALNNCDRIEAAQAMREQLDHIEKDEKYGYEYALCIHRLVTSILVVVYNAGASLDQVLKLGKWNSISSVYELTEALYDKNKVSNVLEKRLINPVIDTLTEYRGSNSIDLVKNITRMIKEHKGDITLQECADTLNYHPSYIWKVLKLNENTTFTEMANREKITIAKDYLLHSDCGIAAIAEDLHYSNVQNFTRFFNKYVHQTPNKWRQEHKKEKDT